MPKPKQSQLDDFSDKDKVQGGNFWDYKQEQSVIGLFREWLPDGFGEHAVLQTEETPSLHLPNLTALNGRLKAGLVKSGDKVKIQYIGVTKSKKTGRNYEDFDVFIKSA